MAVTQARMFTCEDYRRLPGDLSGCQLINGEIYIAPAPNLRHQRLDLYDPAELRASFPAGETLVPARVLKCFTLGLGEIFSER